MKHATLGGNWDTWSHLGLCTPKVLLKLVKEVKEEVRSDVRLSLGEVMYRSFKIDNSNPGDVGRAS